jgi:hypothetical protein
MQGQNQERAASGAEVLARRSKFFKKLLTILTEARSVEQDQGHS